MKWNIPAEWRVRGLVQIDAPTLADAITKLHTTTANNTLPETHETVFQPRYFCNEEIEEIREMYNDDEPDHIGDTAITSDANGAFISSGIQWELISDENGTAILITGCGNGNCYITSSKLGNTIVDTLRIGSDASDIKNLALYTDTTHGVKHLVIDHGYPNIDMRFGLNNFCHGIVDVTIAEGVRSIGNAAFRYCDNLSTINLPDTVAIIKTNAFSDCHLETIKVGAGLRTIETQAFTSDHLKRLDLSAADDVIWHVSDNEIYGHNQLTNPISIDLPRHLTIIGKRKHIADFISFLPTKPESVTFSAWNDSVITISYTDDPNAIQSVSIRMQPNTNKNPVIQRIFGDINEINITPTQHPSNHQ